MNINTKFLHNLISIISLLTINYTVSYSQEFMHWKFLENKKIKLVKTETVYEYDISDTNSIEPSSIFSYEMFDPIGRTIEFMIYSKDTSFFKYGALSKTRYKIEGDSTIIESITEFKYSETGRPIYEANRGSYETTYLYFYDSLDRVKKMIVLPKKDDFNSKDTIVNLTFYAQSGLDSLRQHNIGGVLKSETRYYYDGKKNLKKRIRCKFDENTICDTTLFHYNNSGQKIHMIQQWHKDNDTTIQIDERHWKYDEKGRMIMASDNVSICRWSYDKNGYVKEAKRYNKENELRFFVKYEYTFWTKKEVRKYKKAYNNG